MTADQVKPATESDLREIEAKMEDWRSAALHTLKEAFTKYGEHVARERAARAALLAAIEKYGKEQEERGCKRGWKEATDREFGEGFALD